MPRLRNVHELAVWQYRQGALGNVTRQVLAVGAAHQQQRWCRGISPLPVVEAGALPRGTAQGDEPVLVRCLMNHTFLPVLLDEAAVEAVLVPLNGASVEP